LPDLALCLLISPLLSGDSPQATHGAAIFILYARSLVEVNQAVLAWSFVSLAGPEHGGRKVCSQVVPQENFHVLQRERLDVAQKDLVKKGLFCCVSILKRTI